MISGTFMRDCFGVSGTQNNNESAFFSLRYLCDSFEATGEVPRCRPTGTPTVVPGSKHLFYFPFYVFCSPDNAVPNECLVNESRVLPYPTCLVYTVPVERTHIPYSCRYFQYCS
ncbi:hypothetical protein GWI33_002509 [Rhynchophorus ferrugineus]|uniref:Uncharacterized protein n=1 Tax=Rhynchophorus ferrugineus TaxID=354439 RepID=A0A834IXK9_RHYFE|nr:hypothetical protein GWI33_002509 [Rhynchophorus ferrugineus]